MGGVLAYDPGAAAEGSWTLAARSGGMGEEDSPIFANAYEGSLARVFVRGPTQQRSVEHACGVTDGYDAIEARFREACSTVGVTDVVIELDTPGGDDAGLIPTAMRMSAVAREFNARGGRVWSVADVCMCSAGYALGCVADKGRMFCPPTGRTASIGVVRLVPNMAGALEMEGVKVTIFRSDEQKMVPSGIEPIDEATAAIIQAEVDTKAIALRTFVASRRGGTQEDYRAFKGASMLGSAALAAGLVDGLATAQEVAAMAGSEAALAAVRGALGLPATASQEDMESRARDGSAALAEVIKLRGDLATIEAGKLALEEQTRRTAAEQARVTARTTFAADVTALRTAGKLSPAAATALLGSPGDAARSIAAVPSYYDRHGEAAARDMLATLQTDAPQVPAVGARGGALPVPAGSGSLTAAQIEHAKSIGADPSAYAAAIMPATSEAS